jgi:hypothetical protein
MNALFARLFLAITPDRLNRFFQAVTFGCGAFLAYAATLTPPVAAGWLIAFGVANLVASTCSKRIIAAAGTVRSLDVIGWAAAAVLQLAPGVYQEFNKPIGRTLGIIFAVGGTVAAMLTHGPASGATGSAS